MRVYPRDGVRVDARYCVRIDAWHRQVGRQACRSEGYGEPSCREQESKAGEYRDGFCSHKSTFGERSTFGLCV